MLAQQANVDNNLSGIGMPGGRYVLETLRRTADTTQRPVAALLNRQKEAGNVESFKSYYIVNAFSVTGNLASA